MRRCLLIAALTMVGMGTTASGAWAYVHTWGCAAGSATRCWDYSGSNPNPWEYVSGTFEYYNPEVCAKAVTPANNTRTGSGCNYNSFYRYSNIAGGYPESVAYIYHGGGPYQLMSGRAGTSD